MRYTSYAEFIERFQLLWQATLDHFGPTQVLRQGLRYVDHFESQRLQRSGYLWINPELLGPLLGAFGSGVRQSVSELQFPQDDGVLVFKHGLVPLGPQANMGYLLDFDSFTEDPGEPDPCSVTARFDRYHDLIYRFFRWCLADDAMAEIRRAD